MATKTQTQKEAQEAARIHLRELLPPGSTVYTILRHVSKSGMARDISLVVNGKAGIINITHWVAAALGETVHHGSHDAIRVNGCGMDMGFHLVYNLSAVLWTPTNNANPGQDYGYNLRHDWL
jgi:hypothetical protein